MGNIKSTNPNATDMGMVVRQAPQDTWSTSFTKVNASTLDSPEMLLRTVGSGVTVSQASGNLAVVSGVATNAEFLARSTITFNGALIHRHQILASQRIANNNFTVMLADRIIEDTLCTINSATSISVRVPEHGFTAANVGQSMMIGGIVGAAGVPGRYAIASIPNKDTINFTVAGWPASGTCRVDVFGWNYIRWFYTGATATTVNVDSQRYGWNLGDTAATINTTASPGHMAQTAIDGRNIYFADALVASSTAPTVTVRAHRVVNVPDDDVELHLYMWGFNGTTAPASTTTWTVGFVSIEDVVNVPTYIAGFRATGFSTPLPVVFPAAPTITLGAGTALAGDVGVQYRTTASGLATTNTHFVAAGSTNATSVKATAGKVFGWYFANTTAAWRYVKLHNIATAPTAGSGVVRTIGVPPNGVASFYSEGGITFATGIGLTMVTGAADADATAVTANDIVGELFYA